MSKPADRFLPYGRQQIDDDDIAAVTEVLRSDFLTTGPTGQAFETAFAARTGAKHAAACSSGTAALHLAAAVAGLGPGDNAVVPAITFLATANAVRYVGAEVVFADIDADSGLMTPESFERACSEKTRAVLPVHLNGQCCDMVAIHEHAQTRSLKIIEDASHFLGGTGPGNAPAGSCTHSDMTVFSAHPVKSIAMGEGGIVTTNDQAVAVKLKNLRNHGMERNPVQFTNADQAFAANGSPNPWYYEMPSLGFNYRASDIHCALGLSQLSKLDNFVAKRNALVEYYRIRLGPLAPAVRPITRQGHGAPAWHASTVLIDFAALKTDRATIMNELREHGIGSQVLYMPLYRQPYYQQRYGKQRLSGAESYYARALCLPLFVDITEADIDRVVETLANLLGLKAG